MMPGSLEKKRLVGLHPSHRLQMRNATAAVAFLLFGVIAAKLLPVIPAAIGISGYLPLHTLLETISVVIAMLVFAVGWNAHRRGLPGNILLLSCAFFGVGALDFTHTLSYTGMPDFVTPSSPDKAIDFWLAARTLAAIALFAVSMLAWRKLSSSIFRYIALASVCILVAVLHWLFLYHNELLPEAFIPGRGLTPFKINYEYALVALNLVTALVLLKRMRTPLPFNAAAMFGAVCAMALSEYFFTIYTDFTDIYNLLGHIYKIVSYFFLYRAVFVSTVEHPYNQLHASQNQLQATLDAIPDLLFEVDMDGRFHDYHSPRADLLVAPPEVFLGKTIAEVLPADASDICMSALHEAAQHGRSAGKEIILHLPQGERCFELSVATKHEDIDHDMRFIFLSRDVTSRKEAEHALVRSEQNYRELMEQAGDAITVAEHEGGRYMDVNQAACNMMGYTREEFLEIGIRQLIHPDDLAKTPVRFEEMWSGKVIHTERRLRRKDGRYIQVEMTSKMLPDGRLISIKRDVTQRKQAEADLRIAAVAFESQESLLITDADGVILRVNKAFTESTGYTSEEVVGQTPRILKSGRHDAAFYAAMWQSIHSTGTWQGEIWDRRKNGEIYPKWLTITAVKGEDRKVTHYVGSHTDITKRKAAEEEIKHLAFYDPLTRLPNRRLLMDWLQHALVASARNGRKGALLFIDLDNFKTLNDTLGHAIGDLLLQQVAQRLQSCVRDGDTVARLGGDEFVVMLEDLSEQALEAAAQTEAVGEKILATFVQPFLLAGQEHTYTSSIGAALINGHQHALEELLKQADIAMYQAKKSGRNTLRFFDPQMQASIAARASMETQLRQAMEKGQFHVHYQIQVDSSSRALGAEALIRWLHPERGLVSPAQFISLAEETGLILPIGQWVLDTACVQLKAWQQKALTRDLVLAVNVSAKQFRHAEFSTQVHAAVQRHGVNPELLKLELTESLLLENIEDTIKTMNALNEIGVQLSLDDFGTGYSSLQYLKRLPLDLLKIDQSFVRDIATSRNDEAIVRTIIAMARSLNLDVIAEGVETEVQRQLLLSNGCNRYQGYLFGRPVPIAQFNEALPKPCQ